MEAAIMKLYDLNLYALGMALGAWLLTWLGYRFLPASWDPAPFYIGLFLYALAFPVLGWSVLRAVSLAVQGSMPWATSLRLVGVTFVQACATLFVFIPIMAEGFTNR